MSTIKTVLLVLITLVVISCGEDDPNTFPEPNPPEFSNPKDRITYELEELGYPVSRNDYDVPFVPGQYLLDFSLYTDEERQVQLDSIKSRFGSTARLIKTCGCKYSLELWQIDTLRGNENGKNGSKEVSEAIGHEEVKENYYVLPDIDLENGSTKSFNGLPTNFTIIPTASDAVTIALMDTGLDYTYQDEQVNGEPRIPLWKNPLEELNGVDDLDTFCFVDDIIGWDFVNDDNDPMDDNSHGTHIAGIIADVIRENAPDVKFKFMPLKILDHNGVGNTFDAICAALYVAEMKAEVVNASFGYYGDSHEMLSQAIRSAQIVGGANIMCSAGNHGVAIIEDHFPGSWYDEHKGIVQWSFLDADGVSFHPMSNYITQPLVNLAALGTNILSIVPKHLIGIAIHTKTGSSMATARESAVTAAFRYRNPNIKPVVARNLLTQAVWTPDPEVLQYIAPNGDTVKYIPIEWVE